MDIQLDKQIILDMIQQHKEEELAKARKHPLLSVATFRLPIGFHRALKKAAKQTGLSQGKLLTMLCAPALRALVPPESTEEEAEWLNFSE